MAVTAITFCVGLYCNFDGSSRSAIVEVLKTAVVLLSSWYVSIPACLLLDQASLNYQAHRAAGSTALAAVRYGVRDALYDFPWLGPALRRLLAAPAPAPAPADLHPGRAVHDGFRCPITLDPLDDPVVLHGWPFSRAPITAWVRARRSHPFTRAPAAEAQIMPPPPAFAACYAEYLAVRARIVREQAAAAAAASAAAAITTDAAAAAATATNTVAASAANANACSTAAAATVVAAGSGAAPLE